MQTTCAVASRCYVANWINIQDFCHPKYDFGFVLGVWLPLKCNKHLEHISISTSIYSTLSSYVHLQNIMLGPYVHVHHHSDRASLPAFLITRKEA